MAIPPIISGLPIFRLFKTGGGKAQQSREKTSPQGGDIVQISDAAKQKLEAAQILTAGDPGKIRAVTSQIKHYIERNPVSLGLNPLFE